MQYNYLERLSIITKNESISKKRESIFKKNDSILILILKYVPYAYLLLFQTCNKLLYSIIHCRLISHFNLFHNYTIVFDLGQRNSRIPGGKHSKNPLTGKHGNSREVVISDRSRMITITTNNIPLRSRTVRIALHFICNYSSVNRLRFARLIRRPRSCAASPRLTYLDHTTRSENLLRPDIPSMHINTTQSSVAEAKKTHLTPKLQTLEEGEEEGIGRDSIHTPAMLRSSNILVQSSLPSFPDSVSLDSQSAVYSPISRDYSASGRYSRQSSILFSLRSHTSDRSDEISLYGYDSEQRISIESYNSHIHLQTNDPFQNIMHILSHASIEYLKVGERCASWTWETIIYVLNTFEHLQHLSINICGFDQTLPKILIEKEWLNFIGHYVRRFPPLKSLCCQDENLMRALLTIIDHRNLADQLIYNYPSFSESLIPIDTNNNNKNIYERPAQVFDFNDREFDGLQFARFQSPIFSNNIGISGIDFSHVKIMELVAWEDMNIAVPPNVISFRLSHPDDKSFADRAEKYNVIFPENNQIIELCVYSINFLKHFRGIQCLTHLKYLVVKKTPSSIESFRKRVKRLCKNSPLKCISVLWKSISRKVHRDPVIFDMSNIKAEFKCPDTHPTKIDIYDKYYMPYEFKDIIDIQSLIFSDFKPKNIRYLSTALLLKRQENVHFNCNKNVKRS